MGRISQPAAHEAGHILGNLLYGATIVHAQLDPPEVCFGRRYFGSLGELDLSLAGAASEQVLMIPGFRLWGSDYTDAILSAIALEGYTPEVINSLKDAQRGEMLHARPLFDRYGGPIKQALRRCYTPLCAIAQALDSTWYLTGSEINEIVASIPGAADKIKRQRYFLRHARSVYGQRKAS